MNKVDYFICQLAVMHDGRETTTQIVVEVPNEQQIVLRDIDMPIIQKYHSEEGVEFEYVGNWITDHSGTAYRVQEFKGVSIEEAEVLKKYLTSIKI